MDLKNVKEFYPLSPIQEGMLFHSLYSPELGIYFEQVVHSLQGNLDLFVFKRAWHWVVEEHAILRTAFVWDGLKEPIQVVREQVKLHFEELDWQDFTQEKQSEKLAAYLQADRERGFNLSEAPLMRMAVVQVAEEAYQFIWSYHHLLLDGWSVPLVLKDVFACYDAFSRGQDIRLQKIRPYKEFVKWLKQQDLSKTEDYWRRMLKGFSTPTTLNVERIVAESSEEIKGYGDEQIKLSPEATAALKTFARRHHLTLNTIIQGAWALMLARYSGEEDVVFGITVSGRPAELTGVESMVGVFINTLPIRVSVLSESPIVPWLRQLQTQLTELRQYEFTPLVQVQKWSEVSRGLFDSIVVFENFPANKPEREKNGGLWVGEGHYYTRTNYPLTAQVLPEPEFTLRLLFDRNRFDDSSVIRMLEHFRNILEGFSADQDRHLSDISLLTKRERHHLLVELNNTQTDYPQDKRLHELFEAQVERTPDAVALVYEDQSLSYRELDIRANRLAHFLQRRGVGPEVLVGICIERSIEMVVGLYGVLKAGGAYVPLDPDYPSQRLEYMLDDASTPILLTQEHLLERLPEQSTEIICLDRDWSLIESQSGEKPDVRIRPDNLAYMIYTSGSTGNPKGALNAHQGICNRLMWMQQEYRLTPDDVIIQKTPFSFDVSVWEFFWPLMTGARLVMAIPNGHKDPAYLIRTIKDQKVTVMHFVPSMLRAFLEASNVEECRSLRDVICSGEALSYALQEQFFSRLDSNLHNLYGPAEAAVDVTYWPCRRESDRQIVPIGRPVANTQIYILDDKQQPQPIGVPGELHIGGIQVGRGYHNRPELTAEKFIPDPFAEDPNARLYKTGDLTRYLPDGNIEYLGRLDFQVKLRGIRIELGEIEAALEKHEDVSQAVVTVREDRPGDKYLTAYISSSSDHPPVGTDLRAHLRSFLPEYMLPQCFVDIDTFPLNPSGKVDRKQLPAPERGKSRENELSVFPLNPNEERLARIWTDLLDVPQIGANDNFFTLGGDEMIAVQVSDRARQEGLQITTGDILEHQTLQGIAAAAVSTDGQAVSQDVGYGLFPLTPIQSWFFDGQSTDIHHWNQAYVFELKRPIDVDHVESAIEHVLSYHDALRLRFEQVEGGWRQEYGSSTEWFKLHREDFSDIPSADQPTAITDIAAKLQTTLSPLDGRLLCAAYFDRGPDMSGRLFIAVHHLAIDTVSWRILLEDLETVYWQLHRGEQVRLPDKTTSYKNWARRLSEYGRSDEFQSEAVYWRELPTNFSPAVPPDMSVDGSDDEADSETVIVRLTPDETRALQYRVPSVYKTQINDVLLGGLALSFKRRTSSDSLLLYLEGHGREELWKNVHIGRTVGWFTSLFPVNLHLMTESLEETIISVRDQLRQIPNRGFGYGVMNYLTNDDIPISEPKPFCQPEFIFNYLGQIDRALAKSSLLGFASESPGPIRSHKAQRIANIEIIGLLSDGRLEFHWSFSRRRHRRLTIKAIADDYVRTLNELIVHCLLREMPRENKASLSPRNQTEESLTLIWADVLDVYQISVYDNFFEIGGHSLLAIQMISRIRDAFNIEMPLQVLIDAPTVASLAKKLDKMIDGSRTSQIGASSEDTDHLEPRTETEHRLLSIWKRILNTNHIGIRDNFVDLQGNSDVIEMMLAEVKSEFGVFAEGFPVNEFLEEPTIETLARIIEENIEQKASSLVVSLKPHGPKPPLFLIHGGGGYVFFYRALAARLGTDQPVYGIRAETESDEMGRPFSQIKSIEEIAERYIAEMKHVQPKGPYFLGGACIGAVIAFEMAQQLHLQGEDVLGPVLVFDGYVHNNPYLPDEEETMIFRELRIPAKTGTYLENLHRRITEKFDRTRQMNPWKAFWHITGKIVYNIPSETAYIVRAVIRRLGALLSRLAGLSKPKVHPMPETGETPEQMQEHFMKDFMTTSARVLLEYVPRVYPGSIAVFKGKNNRGDMGRTWVGLAQKGIVEHVLPGHHLDMMEEPAVIETAALVSKHLNEDLKPDEANFAARPDFKSTNGLAQIRHKMVHSANKEEKAIRQDISLSAVKALKKGKPYV